MAATIGPSAVLEQSKVVVVQKRETKTYRLFPILALTKSLWSSMAIDIRHQSVQATLLLLSAILHNYPQMREDEALVGLTIDPFHNLPRINLVGTHSSVQSKRMNRQVLGE